MDTLIRDISELRVPPLPEFDDLEWCSRRAASTQPLPAENFHRAHRDVLEIGTTTSSS